MKQKLLTIVMVMCLVIAASVMPASAALPDDGGIELMAMYHSNANAELSISSSGNANVKCKIIGIPGTTTSTKMYVYLQQYIGGSWVNIGSWSDEANTVNLTIEESMAVDSGYKYRVEASCYAYSGSAGEHVTKYSAEVRYNG